MLLQDRMPVATSESNCFSKSLREMVSDEFVWTLYEKTIVSSTMPPSPLTNPGTDDRLNPG
jgi:hypothetical protein